MHLYHIFTTTTNGRCAPYGPYFRFFFCHSMYGLLVKPENVRLSSSVRAMSIPKHKPLLCCSLSGGRCQVNQSQLHCDLTRWVAELERLAGGGPPRNVARAALAGAALHSCNVYHPDLKLFA